ncbi:hypothetical protein HYW83_03795 [Candidatus Peregrinibacteria bacterium]|nr:hypothetical protein [Candidatus Peregrinibacteria bacterium]
MKRYVFLAWIISFFFVSVVSVQSAVLPSTQVSDFSLWKVTSTSVILNWSPFAGADFYKIQVRSDDDQKVIKTIKISAKVSKKKIQGLKFDTIYLFKICPQIDGHCIYGDDISARTKPTFFLNDDYEQSTKADLARGSIRYVEGNEGYGFLNVYGKTAEGGELRANIARYDNSDGQLVDAEIGTVELWVKPTIDLETDTEVHGLFTAWSEDGMNNWDIEVYRRQLIVSREYSPCIRSILTAGYNFKKDTWYKLTLTWRGQVTNFFINDAKIGDFKNEPRNVYLGRGEAVYVGDDVFVTDSLRIKTSSRIPVSALSISTTEEIQCPEFIELLEKNVQEEYKGIQLHNFSDEETREKIKEFINVLPDTYQTEIKHIVVVEDAQYELVYSKNVFANFMAGGAMYLKKSFFDTAEKIEASSKTFFHEAGHGHIYAHNLGYGGPRGNPKRKEWADISGIQAYVGECSTPTDFVLEDGFLSAYGSTMPDEDLAEWVGFTIDMYRKGATFSSLLNKKSKKYSPKYQKKLDFLLAKGFISQTIYDNVTKTTRNASDYVVFN